MIKEIGDVRAHFPFDRQSDINELPDDIVRQVKAKPLQKKILLLLLVLHLLARARRIYLRL